MAFSTCVHGVPPSCWVWINDGSVGKGGRSERGGDFLFYFCVEGKAGKMLLLNYLSLVDVEEPITIFWKSVSGYRSPQTQPNQSSISSSDVQGSCMSGIPASSNKITR